jgi:hypothetical protein
MAIILRYNGNVALRISIACRDAYTAFSCGYSFANLHADPAAAYIHSDPAAANVYAATANIYSDPAAANIYADHYIYADPNTVIFARVKTDRRSYSGADRYPARRRARNAKLCAA